MNDWSARLQKTSILRVNALVRSLLIAGIGLVGLPVAAALQSTVNLPASTDHGVQAGFSTGRIQHLDISLAAVTVQHEPIATLGMPDMTMVFRVEHPRSLTGLNVGDRVRFEVRRVKGALVIYEIDKAP